jgi:hypothetical protein
VFLLGRQRFEGCNVGGGVRVDEPPADEGTCGGGEEDEGGEQEA